MSGGSFNYLCYKDVPDLMNPSSISELESMALYLMNIGYEDIAKDTKRLIEYIKSASLTIEVLSQQLNDVFHAVEWYESGDWGRDGCIEELEKYRKNHGLKDGAK